MKMRWKGFLALTVAIVFLSIVWVTIIGGMGYFTEDREEITETFQLQAGANLTVMNYDGKIELDVWEGETVELVFVKKTYFGKDELGKLNLLVDNDDRDLHLGIDREKMVHWVHSDFTIKVPESVNVTNVETDSGKIDIDGTSGDLKVKADSADIIVRNIDMVVKISSDNGGISVKDCNIVKRITTNHGGVLLEDCGYVEYVSVGNGGVDATDIISLEEVNVDNGGIHVNVMKVPEDGMHFSVTNGGIIVKLPKNTTARFDLGVNNGEVDVHGFDKDFFDEKEEEEKVGYLNINFEDPSKISNVPLIKLRAKNGGIDLQGV